MSNLVKYDAACRAIAEARTVDEAKGLKDKAAAMQAYARQSKNKQMEIDAAEIRMRAERRLGELIKWQKETVGLNKGGNPNLPTGSKKEPVEKPPTLAEVGIDKKLSSRAQKMAAVPEDKFEEMVGEWREKVEQETERVSTNLLREGEKAKKIEELREKANSPVAPINCLYDVIVIDPPWPIQKIERDVRPNQVAMDYPTMDLEEMRAMTIPAEKDCHLWLWTTQKFLPKAFGLIMNWGFDYVCTFVWHKPGGFQCVGLPQYNCEFVVYARKGSPIFIDTKAFSTCFNAPRGKHSEKPEEFYEMIRRTTGGRRLDMFNRRKIEGFIGWGNEAV